MDDKGISGAESNVVQGHKRIQQGTTDCLLEEKEKLTKAITQTTQEPQVLKKCYTYVDYDFISYIIE